MPRRQAARLIWTLCAVAMTAAIGAGATAQPGGEPAPLAPTESLTQDGGVEAPPVSSVPTGGVEAPGENPGAPQVPAAAPPEPQPEQHDAAALEQPGVEPAEEAEEAEAVSVGTPEEPAKTERPPAQPPTEREALEAAGEPLVPVEILSGPVASARDTAPLIDVTPEDISSPPLAQASQDEDGDVVIEVPEEDLAENEEDAEAGPRSPAEETPAAGLGLPRTGREVAPWLAAALVLIGLGLALRITAPPSASPGARA